MTARARVAPVRVALRPPSFVMRLSCLGAFHQTRLSFMRSLLRRLRAEKWRFSRPLFALDARGVGRAVYRAQSGDGRVFSLVAFARDLPAALRSDRVIATAWDAAFALFDGDPTTADLDRLVRHAPRQEAGRYTARELALSRANRSARLFSHCVDRLAAGLQPQRRLLLEVGYLMRTTAVYGNGKFGLADRDIACARFGSRAPFQAELLAVWLARAFAVDWVEHLARARNPNAAGFSSANRRSLGIGNSTGLGMAPFLMNHPALLHRWILARETALQRARAASFAAAAADGFLTALARMQTLAAQWQVDDPTQQAKIERLRIDLAAARRLAEAATSARRPGFVWDDLYRWGQKTLSPEGRECLVGLLIEPHGALVDDLCERMDADEERFFDFPAATVARLRRALARPLWLGVANRFFAPRRARAVLVCVGRKTRAAPGRARRRAGGRFGIAARHRARHLRARPRSRARPRCRAVGVVFVAPSAPSLCRAPRRLRDAFALRRNPRQPYRRRNAADRFVALQVVVFRRDSIRSALRSLVANRDVSKRAVSGRVCARARRRLGAAQSRLIRAAMQRVARNEIEALAKKAARGAGLSWGLAEDAGKAARLLATHPGGGIESFVETLEARLAARFRVCRSAFMRRRLAARARGATMSFVVSVDGRRRVVRFVRDAAKKRDSVSHRRRRASAVVVAFRRPRGAQNRVGDRMERRASRRFRGRDNRRRRKKSAARGIGFDYRAPAAANRSAPRARD